MFKLKNHKAYLESSLNDQLSTPIIKTSAGLVSTARKPKSVSVGSLKVLIVMFVLICVLYCHGSNNHSEMAYEYSVFLIYSCIYLDLLSGTTVIQK